MAWLPPELELGEEPELKPPEFELEFVRSWIAEFVEPEPVELEPRVRGAGAEPAELEPAEPEPVEPELVEAWSLSWPR